MSNQKQGLGLVLVLKEGDQFVLDVDGERVVCTILERKGRNHIRIAIKGDRERVQISSIRNDGWEE